MKKLYIILICIGCLYITMTIRHNYLADKIQSKLLAALPKFTTERSLDDSLEIVNSLMEMFEYYRLYYPFGKYVSILDSTYSKYIGFADESAYVLGDHSCVLDNENDTLIGSPWSTEDQVEVSTEAIFYDTDSLLCVAFVCVRDHYRLENGLQFGHGKRREYAGQVYVGFRDSIGNRLKILRLHDIQTFGMSTKEDAIEILADAYMRDGYYGYRLGTDSFFRGHPLFEKRQDGHYEFEYYYNQDTRDSALFQYICNVGK